MTNKETRISSIAIIVGFGLWFILITHASCEKVIQSKPKSKPVFSLTERINKKNILI